MKGLERRMVSVVVGGSSWVCRDVDHSERTMEPSDGIRLPVTEKYVNKVIDGPKATTYRSQSWYYFGKKLQFQGAK